MPDDDALDPNLDRRLRSALEAVAAPADGAGVPASVARRVARHRRRVRSATATVVVVVVVGGIAGASLSSVGRPRRPDRVSAAAPAATAPSNPRDAAGSNGPSVRSYPAPVPPPCPTGASVPSMATGSYCGPRPPAGNGLGPDGECTGRRVRRRADRARCPVTTTPTRCRAAAVGSSSSTGGGGCPSCRRRLRCPPSMSGCGSLPAGPSGG